MVNSIPNDVSGSNLKSIVLQKGITANIFKHVCKLFDPSKGSNSIEWQDSYNKASASYAIQMLNGLCTMHIESQKLLLSESFVIPLLHEIEENNYVKEVATLAESLLNVLAEYDFQANTDINTIRSQTKKKKEKRAKKTRKKLLKSFGWNITQKGAIKQEKDLIDLNINELLEEEGLTCCICGEGFKFKPNELLGIYNYGKVTSFGDFTGFSSVTSFTVIHIKCHNEAVTADARLRPPKSVWEGALIRNGFSQCNCLFPILGPSNEADKYKLEVERYWKQMTRLKSVNERFKTLVLDLTSLVLKLAKIESLSVDSGGGSTLHNLKLVVFEVQMGLFILDDTNERSKYEDTLNYFLSAKNLGLSTISDMSAFYNTILSIFLMSIEEWEILKRDILSKLIQQHRQDLSNQNTRITSDNLFNVCRMPLMFFCLANEFQKCLKQLVESTKLEEAMKNGKYVIRHAKDSKWITELNKRIQLKHMDLLKKFETIAEEVYSKLKSIDRIDSFLELLFPIDTNTEQIKKWIEETMLTHF